MLCKLIINVRKISLIYDAFQKNVFYKEISTKYLCSSQVEGLIDSLWDVLLYKNCIVKTVEQL